MVEPPGVNCTIVAEYVSLFKNCGGVFLTTVMRTVCGLLADCDGLPRSLTDTWNYKIKHIHVGI